MATRQFVGLEGSSGTTQSFEAIREIERNGKIILVIQANDTKKGPFCIVLGYKASEPYRTPQGLSAVLEQVLSFATSLQGPIRFWS